MTSGSRPTAVATVQVDNARVKITEWAFEPGAETGWHTHEMDYVVVPRTSGDLHIDSSDGLAVSPMSEGLSYYRDAGANHNVINDNAFDFVFVEVEIK